MLQQKKNGHLPIILLTEITCKSGPKTCIARDFLQLYNHKSITYAVINCNDAIAVIGGEEGADAAATARLAAGSFGPASAVGDSAFRSPAWHPLADVTAAIATLVTT